MTASVALSPLAWNLYAKRGTRALADRDNISFFRARIYGLRNDP
jgi:hypothetical protein